MLEKARIDKLHTESMTVFFSINTGKIEEVVSGIQDFSYFVEDRLDKESYCENLVYDLNMNILENKGNYIVDLETKEILPNRNEVSLSPKL
ncbi:hypothetical protein FHH43_01525 [Clostridium perfringens]|nr:hypothetical protein [Clostridium perfringens]